MALGLHGALPCGAAVLHALGTVPLLLPISPSLPQLEVLTNLANETNISTILREFQVCHGHTEATRVPSWHGSGCQNTTMEGTEENPTRRSGLRPCQPHGWLQ